MNILSQTHSPRLWLLFQYLLGGTVDKRRFAIMKYSGQPRVLEIGCSVGNISSVFRQYPGIQYTGLDTDPIAIAAAKRHFSKSSNFRFLCKDICELAKDKEKYDYILLGNVCHHIDDDKMIRMLSVGATLLRNNGLLTVLDLILPSSHDNLLVRSGFRIDQGKHIRNESDILKIIGKVSGLKLNEREKHYLGATPFSIPKIAVLGLYVCTRNTKL